MPKRKHALVWFLAIFSFQLSSCKHNKNEIEAQLLNNQAVELINNNQYLEATHILKNAINFPHISNRLKGSIYRNISIAFSELEMGDSAIKYSQLAAGTYPKKSYEYLINSAETLLSQGKVKDALDLFNRALKIRPDEMEVNNNLGLIFLGEYGEEYENPELALRYNKKAYEVSPDNTTQYVLGKNYFVLENYKEAENIFEALHQRNPERNSYILSLYIVKSKLDKIKEADSIWNNVIEKDSTLLNDWNQSQDED